MRGIILATLASGVLLGGTDRVLAECQTLAQARAANPGAYLSYRLVAGARCWFAGSPHRRELSNRVLSGGDKSADKDTDKARQQSPAASSDDKPARAARQEAPIDFRNAYELDSAAPSAGRAPEAQRLAATFDAVGRGAGAIENADWQTARLAAVRDAIYGAQPAPPQDGGPAVVPAARYAKMIAWLLLTIGIGAIGVGVLERYEDRESAPRRAAAEILSAVPSLHARSLHARRLHAREYPSARTPLVAFVAYLEPRDPSWGAWRSARHHLALAGRSLSGWLPRIG